MKTKLIVLLVTLSSLSIAQAPEKKINTTVAIAESPTRVRVNGTLVLEIQYDPLIGPYIAFAGDTTMYKIKPSEGNTKPKLKSSPDEACK